MGKTYKQKANKKPKVTYRSVKDEAEVPKALKPDGEAVEKKKLNDSKSKNKLNLSVFVREEIITNS